MISFDKPDYQDIRWSSAQIVICVQKGQPPADVLESPWFIEAIRQSPVSLNDWPNVPPRPRIVPDLCTDQFAGQNALPATCKRENGTSQFTRVRSSLSRTLRGVSVYH